MMKTNLIFLALVVAVTLAAAAKDVKAVKKIDAKPATLPDTDTVKAFDVADDALPEEDETAHALSADDDDEDDEDEDEDEILDEKKMPTVSRGGKKYGCRRICRIKRRHCRHSCYYVPKYYYYKCYKKCGRKFHKCLYRKCYGYHYYY